MVHPHFKFVAFTSSSINSWTNKQNKLVFYSIVIFPVLLVEKEVSLMEKRTDQPTSNDIHEFSDNISI